MKNNKYAHKYCIAIPVYKETLAITEKVSLKRLYDTIKNKDIVYAFCPIGFDLTEYRKIFPEIQKVEFNRDNFTSIDAYSHLCMKYEFYEEFSAFEYMFIYQLDCYLIEDHIEEWCHKKYDYVGAPILVPHSDWKNFSVDNKGHIVSFSPAVGNGGLSLRKIDTFLELTNPNGELRKRYEMTEDKLKQIKYEDVYFCVELARLYEIRMPKWNEALSFAIDMNPDIAYNDYKFNGLPMGIHAFEKNITFWKDKIQEFDNKELIDYCQTKHKEFIDLYWLKKNEDVIIN